jgi:hypothetical protein
MDRAELAVWLRAQVDIDERERWGIHDRDCDHIVYDTCTCDWSARVQNEVEAKRQILAWLDRLDAWQDATERWQMPDTDEVRKLLARSYVFRPGYPEEWRGSDRRG